MAQRDNRLTEYGYLACTTPQPASRPLSGAAKYPAGARPSKCIIIISLRVGGARRGVIRGDGTNPSGELLNKHTKVRPWFRSGDEGKSGEKPRPDTNQYQRGIDETVGCAFMRIPTRDL
jgi:hypothetical protein